MSTATALNASTADGTGLCLTCQVKPKYFDSSANKLHPYCGKTCAEKAKTQGGGALCIVCQRRPQYVEGTPKAKQGKSTPVPVRNRSKYFARTECLNGRSHYCGRLPEEHEAFVNDTVNSAEQFTKSWRHNSRCPAVKRVFKIVAQKSLVDKYEAYKQSVEDRGNFVAQGRSAGNENRRKGKKQFCTLAKCSLCRIIKTSFDVAKGGKKHSYGRFGHGIYVSSTSSKSNDYSSNLNRNASLKAMLLNKVVVGKGCRKTIDEPSLRVPPAGYDSVLAETGRILNYDECIVYTNDAIRPSFLVMYA
ncbi:ADP-ribosylation [Amylocystis lapponica]|nr:ADP-ribosylation [Amylocystis lapponica]